MNPLWPSCITLVAATAMALHIAVRREKTPFHWLLLAVLAGVALWTGGALLRWSVFTTAGLQSALLVIYTGVLLCPVSWLLLAGHIAQAPFMRRPAALAMICTPPALLYLCVLTNEGHRLFLRDSSFEGLHAGPAAFAGPVFWVTVLWSYGCLAMSVWLHVRAASAAQRQRGRLLVVAALVPLCCNAVYLSGLLPIHFDLTPSGLMGTMLVLYVAVFRYQLLESVPLAHEGVVAQLDDGVLMADRAGRVVDNNPAAERLLGETSAALRGKPLAELIARLRERDSVEIADEDVRDAGGHRVGRFALLRDRSEQQRSEQVVRRAQRLETVGALAAGIAHEINDPLAFVRSNLAHVIRMGEAVDAPHEGADAELAREVSDLHGIAVETLDGVDRIARIVGDMCSLTAEPHGARRRLDLTQVVRDAIRLVRFDEGGAPALEMSLAARDAVVEGSPDRLVQIVVNLLANARHAVAEAGGRIGVQVRRSDDNLEVVVEDDGPGVPAGVRERIFDPFFTTKGPAGGSGLGLAIAYDIARDHGGVLEECSDADGGARFVLRLPAAV